jgi:hypothetical protein
MVLRQSDSVYGLLKHGGGVVDAGDECACCGDLFSQGSVSTADIEDAFADLRGKEGDDAGGKSGDKAPARSIGFCAPGLAGGKLWGRIGHASIVHCTFAALPLE